MAEEAGGVSYNVDVDLSQLMALESAVDKTTKDITKKFDQADKALAEFEKSEASAAAASANLKKSVDALGVGLNQLSVTGKSAATESSALNAQMNAIAESSARAQQAANGITSALQKQRDGVAQFIAKLKEENDTLGLNAAELNQYRAAKLGASEKDQQIISNITSQIEAYKRNEAAIEANAQALTAANQKKEAARQSLDTLIQSLQFQAATLGKSTREIILYRATQEGATVADRKAIIQALNAIDIYEKRTDATRRASLEMKKLNQSMRGAFGGLRGQASNFGFQLQDIAVQAQMGTNALVILGQQGSQFLGAMGPAGALAGAGVAVLAASLTVLMPNLMSSKKATDRLEESMKSLGGVTIETENSVSVLTKEIESLYAVSKEAALAQIITGLVSAKNATKEAGAAIREEFGKVDGSFGPFGTSIDEAIEKFDSITQRSKDFGKVSRKEIADQSAVYKDFGKTLGAVGGDAEALGFNIVNALSSLKKTGDVQAFQAAFAGLVTQYGASNEKLATFNAKLTEFFTKARTAAEATKFLEQAQSDLAGTLQKSGESTEPVIRSLNQQLAIQKVALKDGAVAAELLAAAFSLGKTSVEQLPAPIRALIEEINKLKNNTIITELGMQEAQLRMTGNEYEIYAAKQSAALSGATAEQIAAIEARIKGLQDLRLGLEAVSDQETEDNAKRSKTIELETSLKTGLGLTPLQALQNQQKAEIEALKLANQQKLIDKAEYEARFTELTRQQTEARTKLVRDEQTRQRTILGKGGQEVLGAIGDAFGAFAAIAQQGGEKSFQTYKNLASAQAAIAASLAIIKAYAEGGPIAGPILAGAIAGVTGVQIAAIQKQQFSGSGRLYGGPVGGGKLYPFMEDGKPEALQMGGKTYLWTGGGNGNVVSNKDMASGGGGNGVNVSVVVENYGSDKVSVSREQGRGVTSEEVIKIVVGNINERGQVHSAITRSTTAGNRT